MKNNINILNEKFKLIKNKELNVSLRSGTTGIGYTFENLLGKEEDNSFAPDYNGIEIKCKLGYSNSPITLFTLTPKIKYSITNQNYDSSSKFILDNFGYITSKDPSKRFRGDAFCNKENIIANRYIFKIVDNSEDERLELYVFNTTGKLLNNDIFWEYKELKKRLYAKLNYLAIIKGYPYKRNYKTYYKYTNISFYKLRNFVNFIDLVKRDLINITFNIDIFKNGNRIGQIHDRGTAFKLNIKSIEELFLKIKT